MSDLLASDLRQQLVSGRALLVVGSGVAAAATGGAPTATWGGLLMDGIERVEALGVAVPDGWGAHSRRQVESGDLAWMLSAAEEITHRLSGPAGGEFAAWLRASVGSLRVEDAAVAEALANLGVPLATTNYDGLIEDVTGLRPVTWRDGASIQRVLRGDEQGVLHLHGHWERPDTVVLGVRSYEAVLGDGAAQALQHATAALSSLVFVGFGAGLADPNFAALRAWVAARFSSSEYRHFRLCHAGELDAVRAVHAPEERIVPVVYGARHDDLAGFLRDLAPARARGAKVHPQEPTSSDGLPAAPSPLGRDDEVAAVVDALLDEAGPVIVLGGPGIGKSTVCLAAAHDARVVTQYGDRRWFVRLDGATTAAAALSALATEIGVTAQSGASLLAGVTGKLAAAPGLVVLDNLETPWAHDPLATEDLVARLSSVPGLGLVVAVRGVARPAGARWARVVSLAPLQQAAARSLFLSIAGDAYAQDPGLDPLLAELDGVPLALELLAFAAHGEPDLDALARRWEDERVALLERLGGGDPVLSVAASVEVSLNSPLLMPGGRRLLLLLGQLPDGIAHDDLEPVFGAGFAAAASNARQLGLAVDDANRLRTLAPVREHLAASHPPSAAELAHLTDHYFRLAQVEGNRIGWAGGGDSVRRLSSEAGNLERLIQLAREARAGFSRSGELALQSLLRYMDRTGHVVPGTVDAAVDAVRAAEGDPERQGDLLTALGSLDQARYDHDRAVERLRRAQALYEQAGLPDAQASCTYLLGVVAWTRHDVEEAVALFESARVLSSSAGDELGEANAVAGLGDIALWQGDTDHAEARYEHARELFVRVNDPLGQANCIMGTAIVARTRGNLHDAGRDFATAYRLFEAIGDVFGVSNSSHKLGLLALEGGDYTAARTHCERSLAGFEQLGEVLGCAACHLLAGELCLADGTDEDGARTHWLRALELGRSVDDDAMVSGSERLLASIASADGDEDPQRALTPPA